MLILASLMDKMNIQRIEVALQYNRSLKLRQRVDSRFFGFPVEAFVPELGEVFDFFATWSLNRNLIAIVNECIQRCAVVPSSIFKFRGKVSEDELLLQSRDSFVRNLNLVRFYNCHDDGFFLNTRECENELPLNRGEADEGYL